MHPAKELYCTKSCKLKGKRIVLCVTGSIAAVETVKLIRELIRHGADIVPVMSRAAQRLISPDALELASSKKPIVELTGAVEHVALCGEVEDKADLLVIAPSTANTISKIAAGIDDTTVTTFATTAIGAEIPMIIVPAMHISMYQHPILTENIDKLKSIGVAFIEPKLEEHKAKMPSNAELVGRIIRKIGKNDLRGKKILVVAGSTREPIDDVRVITNISSGKTGIELARAAYERGADVQLLYGYGSESLPTNIDMARFTSVDELAARLEVYYGFDIIAVPAAIADYTTDKYQGKLASRQALNLRLRPTPKVLDIIREHFNGYLIGFKLECRMARDKLIANAHRHLQEHNLDLIVANDISRLARDTNDVFIIDGDKNVRRITDHKAKIADALWDVVSDHISRSAENTASKRREVIAAEI